LNDDQGARHTPFPMKGQGIKVSLLPTQVEKMPTLLIRVHGVGHKCRGNGQTSGQGRSGGDQFVLYVVYHHPTKPFPVSEFFYDFLETLWALLFQQRLDRLFEAFPQKGRSALKVNRQPVLLLPHLHKGEQKNNDADYDDNRKNNP
jgi:hypothetical protein